MSLLDDVSIVVTPNGYKAGTLFGAIPVPTEGAELVTNGDFATDSDWNLDSSFSISGGLLTQNGTAGRTFQSISALESGLGTYIKVTFTVEAISSGQFVVTCYGVSSPVVTTTGTYTFTGVTSDTTNLYVNNGGYFANGSISNISVKEYTSADMDVTRGTDATRVDENGLVEKLGANVPRIDYTGGGCPHILAEPQRTNLITDSQDFSNAAWSKLGSATVIADTTISPDGTLNADSFSFTTSTSDKIQQTVTVVASQQYTVSCYIKSDSNITIKMGGAAASTPINVTTEWVRHTVTQTNGAGTTAYPQLSSNGTAGTVHIYGFQLEQGSYATSYIPTSGSTVTRNQDIFTRDGIGSLINSTEGVLFVEMAALANDGTYRTLSISDGTTANRVAIRYKSSVNEMQVFVVALGATQVILTKTGLTITDFNKVAIKWKVNDFAMWIGGVEIDTDLSGDVPVGINSLNFNSGVNTNDFFGKVRQLQVYDTALTDDQLRQITQ